MSGTFLAAAYSIGTSLCTASFSLIVRRGQQHGSAITGVVIGRAMSYGAKGWWFLMFADPAAGNLATECCRRLVATR